TQLQRQQASTQLGWQQQSLNLQASQFAETQAFNKAVTQRSYARQQEDFTFQHDVTMQQRGWTEQDWAYNLNTQARHYGWQQEDFDIEIRRAQGFDRRQLMKEKQRSTIDYDTSRQHELTAEDHQKQLWKEQDQQFDKEKKRAKEDFDTKMREYEMEM